MDVEKYITEKSAHEAYIGYYESTGDRHDTFAAVLRAVLPGVLAQHRADVLREAAMWFDVEPGSQFHSKLVAKLLWSAAADEVVGS